MLWTLLGAIAFGQDAGMYDTTARALARQFNDGDAEGMFRAFNDDMKRAVPEAQLRRVLTELADRVGKIQTVGPAEYGPGRVSYRCACERGALDLTVVLDGAGRIAGLWFEPVALERNQTRLSLPFRGTWFVLWGGDTPEQNRHVSDRLQRRAFDFVVVDENGKTHKGDGRRNEDYYAFEKEILAPGDGVVTEAADGVRDNVPGSRNPYAALGNYVVIRHSDQEFSVLAHFKQGSIKVKAGERVERGQVLGLCGNSGNSSEPHLHYHLQTAGVIQNGVGLKVHFEALRVNGKERKDYSPVKGERISP